MSKLTEQIKNICGEIDIGQANHEHIIAIEAYTSMIDDCKPVIDNMALSTDQRAVLSSELSLILDSANKIDEKDKKQTVVACWHELETIWVEKDYQVKQGGEFSKFTTAASSYAKALADNNRLVFRLWVTERDAEIAVPEAALDTQRRVPHLTPVVETYDKYYGRFKQLTKSLPTIDTARSLLDLLDHIQDVKSEMVFDLPEPVKKFFHALQVATGGGGAPLKLLTEEVRSWLEEHEQTESYVIRRKGQSSW